LDLRTFCQRLALLGLDYLKPAVCSVSWLRSWRGKSKPSSNQEQSRRQLTTISRYNALAGIADTSNSFFLIPVAHFPWSEKGREKRSKVDNEDSRAAQSV